MTVTPHALILLLLKIVICKILHEFHSGFQRKARRTHFKTGCEILPLALAEIRFVVTLDKNEKMRK